MIVSLVGVSPARTIGRNWPGQLSLRSADYFLGESVDDGAGRLEFESAGGGCTGLMPLFESVVFGVLSDGAASVEGLVLVSLELGWFRLGSVAGAGLVVVVVVLLFETLLS